MEEKKKKKAWEIAYFSMKAAIGFFFFPNTSRMPARKSGGLINTQNEKRPLQKQEN